MKARTKLERRVLELGDRLPALSKAKLEWAFGLFPKYGLYLKKGEVWCQCCGYLDRVLIPELAISLEVGAHICPRCGATLTLKHHQRGMNTNEGRMVSFIQRFAEWNVIRTFMAERTNRKGEPTGYEINEVYRNWVNDDGREVVTARPYTRSPFHLTWQTGKPMQIARHNHSCNGAYDMEDMFDPSGNWFYPRMYVTGKLRRNGWQNRFPAMNLPPVATMRQLLMNPVAETIVKQGQINVFRHMLRRGDYQLPYRHALNICHRNGYIIEDAQMWFDYLELLSYFNLDTHSPHYVCPSDLKAKHDRLMKKKEEEEARREEAERAKRLKRAEKRYARDKAAFIGLVMRDGEMAARVLGSVEEFFREGKAMHHCVYTREYYSRPDSLILSATVGGKRMETVEVSLRTFSIVQSRAACNGVSPYHNRIIEMVNRNMNMIRERMKR